MKDGEYAYEGLDRLLHERARLSLLTALSTAEDGRLFTDLRRLCDLTDGNLNRHLQVLKEHGLVGVKKRGEGRASESRVRLTASGRRTFLRYLDELERVLRDARGVAEPGAVDRGDADAGADDDPTASLGKHALTPTLALTTVAATTRCRRWSASRCT